MSVNLTSFEPILKTLYIGQKVKDLVYPAQPFYGMVPKFEKFVGESMPLPLKFENNQSISATFKVGNAIGGSSKYGRFDLKRHKKYGFATVDGETARASKDDKGAFLSAIKSEIDNTKKGIAASLNADCFGDGTGALGSLSAYNTSSNEVTLSNAEDIAKIHAGMRIVIYSSAGVIRVNGTTVGGVANTFLVSDRDAVLGKFKLDADPTSIVDTDIIYRAGDKDAVINGLDAWLTPSGSTFLGVDRSQDLTRLGGIHYNGSAASVTYGGVTLPANSDGTQEKALINGVSLLNREGGRPDIIWEDFSSYAELVNELGSKVRYERVSPSDATEGKFGFQALMLNTNYGVIKVMADQNCSKGIAYALTMSSWKLCSLGQPIMIDDLDGNSLLRAADDDEVVARIVGYAELGCTAPGHNARIILP